VCSGVPEPNFYTVNSNELLDVATVVRGKATSKLSRALGRTGISFYAININMPRPNTLKHSWKGRQSRKEQK
jgi:hypothetical protein